MEAPNNWLRRIRQQFFPGEVEETREPLVCRVIIFSVHPDFGMNMGKVLEELGFKVRCILDYSSVRVCFGGNWFNPNIVVVNAGARSDDWVPLAVIEWVRYEHGYKGPIVGCATVMEVQRRMKEAGATETCTPHLWAEAVFPHLGLQPDLVTIARSG